MNPYKVHSRHIDPATGVGVTLRRVSPNRWTLDVHGPVRLPPADMIVRGSERRAVKLAKVRAATILRQYHARERAQHGGGTSNWVNGASGGNRRKRSSPVDYRHGRKPKDAIRIARRTGRKPETERIEK